MSVLRWRLQRSYFRSSPDQQKIIDKARIYKDDKLLKPFEKSSKIIADAYYLSYKGRDPSAALQLIKKELPVITAQLAAANTESDSQYVKDSLRSGMKKLIYDVWLNEYSGSWIFGDGQWQIVNPVRLIVVVINMNLIRSDGR